MFLEIFYVFYSDEINSKHFCFRGFVNIPSISITLISTTTLNFITLSVALHFTTLNISIRMAALKMKTYFVVQNHSQNQTTHCLVP